MEWGCMQALIDFDGWRKWKDFSQTTTTTATKSTKVNSTTVSSTGTGVIAGQKSKRLTDPHSDSTDTNGTPPIQSSNPPIPNSLVALNDKSESADTIGSLDSMESNDSTGTIDQVTTQGDPTVLPPAPINITSTQSYSTAPPKEVTPRKLSASSPRLPSSSSSSSSTRDGFLISPLINGTNDITSASASSSSPTTTATPTAASISYEEARRRKRSSLGRGNGGLSGVLEELEGVGT